MSAALLAADMLYYSFAHSVGICAFGKPNSLSRSVLLRLASLLLVNKMSYKFIVLISQQNEIWTTSLLFKACARVYYLKHALGMLLSAEKKKNKSNSHRHVSYISCPNQYQGSIKALLRRYYGPIKALLRRC